MVKSSFRKHFLKYSKACRREWPLLLTGSIFFLLLLRNPFGIRTLIPNFEPFPDGFHYVTVARCFLSEGVWKLCREGIQSDLPGIAPSVPQAYSIALLPGFVISDDPRTFYFTNVLLAFTSLLLFSRIITYVTKNKVLQALMTGIMVTSYHLYWLPTLAMAENLLLPLYLLSVWLLVLPTTKKQHIALGFTAAAIFFTKYAYLPISASILAIAALKSFKKGQWWQLLLSLFLPFVALLPLSHNFKDSFSFLTSLLFKTSQTTEATNLAKSKFFSIDSFFLYARDYLAIVFGKPARFLWDLRPWYPTYIGILGIIGVVCMAISKSRKQLLALYLGISSGTQILFMSTFYAFDSRYIFSTYFAVLIGFAWLLDVILASNTLKKAFAKLHITPVIGRVGIVLAIGLVYSVPQLIPVKSQIMINLKYAATPWWYLSVLEYNTYFATKQAEQPQLLTLSAPYLIDFYSNDTYSVLPFDEHQDFSYEKQAVWGIPDDQTILTTVATKLAAGENIYLADYGIQATDRFRNTFALYQETFKLEKVHSGCHDLCNIYKVLPQN